MLGTLPSINVCVNEYLSEQSGLTSTLSSEASPGAGESKRRCRARHSEPLPLEAGGDIRVRSFPRGLLEEAGAPSRLWQEIFLTPPCPSSSRLPQEPASYLIPGINQGQKAGSVAWVTWPPAFSWFRGPFPKAGAMLQLWASHRGLGQCPGSAPPQAQSPRPLHAPQPAGRGGGSEAFPERQLPSLRPSVLPGLRKH